MCVLYGRRRVGKTSLINWFCRDKATIFFSALEGSEEDNLRALSSTIMQFDGFAGEANAAPTFPSLQAAFAQVFDLAERRRLIFVIDEYPYLQRACPKAASLLQHLIDKRKESSGLFLIVNGSAISQMQKQFLDGAAPLYGRQTMQMEVKPLQFADLCAYFPKLDRDGVARVYGAYGGIPKYLEFYQTGHSYASNLENSFLQPGAALLGEPENVLRQELRDPATYNTVLTAIAGGSHKYSEISSKSRLTSGNLVAVLKTLELLGLVQRVVPPLAATTKQVLYQVKDNMFRFWYRFIPSRLSLINAGKSALALPGIIEGIDQFMGPVFEQICLEWLWRQDGTAGLPLVFEQAGRWWGNNPERKCQEEIDILAYNQDGQALFCECKWSKKLVGSDILEELRRKSQLPQFSAFPEKSFMLFARKGFTAGCLQLAENDPALTLVDLQSM
jgi:AAA+ ATPase superfamily predicted ATPase